MANGNNMLIFVDAANTSYMNMAANFRGVSHTADDVLEIYFESATGADAYDKIIVAIANEKENEVMKALAGALQGNRLPYLVVMDDVAQTYAIDNLGTAGAVVTSITLGAKGSTGVIENYLPPGDGTGAASETNTKDLELSDSGKTFIVQMHTNTAAFRLPAVAGAAGVKYQFIMSFASDAEATKDFILSTDADAENIMGCGVDAGAIHDTVSTTSVITLDSSAGNVGGGDRLSCICDGTHWYITEMSALNAGAWVVADNAI